MSWSLLRKWCPILGNLWPFSIITNSQSRTLPVIRPLDEQTVKLDLQPGMPGFGELAVLRASHNVSPWEFQCKLGPVFWVFRQALPPTFKHLSIFIEANAQADNNYGFFSHIFSENSQFSQNSFFLRKPVSSSNKAWQRFDSKLMNTCEISDMTPEPYACVQQRLAQSHRGTSNLRMLVQAHIYVQIHTRQLTNKSLCYAEGYTSQNSIPAEIYNAHLCPVGNPPGSTPSLPDIWPTSPLGLQVFGKLCEAGPLKDDIS